MLHKSNAMKVFIALLLTMCLMPQVIYAQTGQIFGKIYDERREGANKARVDIVDNDGQPTGRFVISDVDGNYTIRPLAPGKYNLFVTYKGYESAVNRGIIVSPDKATVIDFELKPTKHEPAYNKGKKRGRN